MKRNEYNQLLDEIEQTIDKSENVPDEIFDSLEQLYRFKPVGSKYYQVKCKALMKNNLMKNQLEKYMELYSKESIYPDNVRLWKQVIEAMEKEGMKDEAAREKYLLNRLTGNCENEETEHKLGMVKEKFVSGNESIENVKELENLYYSVNERFMAMVMYMYGCSLYENYRDEKKRIKYTDGSNMLFAYERIKDGGNFVIIADKEEGSDYDILSYILNSFGCNVYMIAAPMVVEGDYDIRDTVEISMENSIKYDDCTVIPAVSKDGREDNIPYITDYLCKECTDNDFAMVIGQNRTMEILGSTKDICKRFQRLSQFEVTYMEDKTGFGRAGDALSYLEYMYECNVRELVYRKPQCRFSIVVPARNSSVTLEHTLKTCLNQEYTGEFEIVLSDNSSEGNTEVYELYKRINDKRISYYRTPRQLALSKSFEYAYLHTKGEFIIPIGSDDGIFPWALQALEFVLGKRKDADIVVWDRGFYAWPGFNGGQENQLEINRNYEKGQVAIIDDDPKKNFEMIKENPASMYILPNLYINSGFRRRWLQKVYEQTGEILGANCQDIYAGLVNINIDVNTVRICYPITMAGMSDNSIGRLVSVYSEGKENEIIQKVKQQCCADTGLYDMPKTVYGKAVPDCYTDVSGMYECMARLKSKNILKYNIFEDSDSIKKMLEKIIESVVISGDKCYMYVMEGAAVVRNFGPDTEKWYLENIVPMLDEMRVCSENKSDKKVKKTYEEGFNILGGVTLDGARYGVTNVSQAVDLYKSFLHF